MIVTCHVGVALSRPPAVDEWRRYRILAPNVVDAGLTALQVAACTAIPVELHIVKIEREE